MTDRIALALGAVVLAALAADIGLNDSAALIFLGRKGTDLVQWIVFWR